MDWGFLVSLIGCALVTFSTSEVLGYYSILLLVGILFIFYGNLWRIME